MRVLFLANRHPVVETELRSLSQSCDVESYMFGADSPTPATVILTIIRNLNRSIIPLLKLHPPPVPVKWLVYNLYCFSLILKADLLRREHDIIYAHWLYPAGVVALLSAKVSPSKVVSVVWGYDILRFPWDSKYGIQGNLPALVRFVIRKSDAVIVNHAVHLPIVKLLGGMPEGHVRLLPTGVDDISSGIGPIQPDPKIERLQIEVAEKKVVLYVASNVSKIYGILEFMRAIPRVADRIDGSVFVVVGDGKLKETAIQAARDEGLSKRVLFAGKVPHEYMPVLYRMATVVCDLAYGGPGLTSWEAASMGRPVIGVSLGSTSRRDPVVEGETGYIIKNDDYVTLAERLVALLGDDQLSMRLGKNARDFFVHNANVERRANSVRFLFDEITSGKKGKRPEQPISHEEGIA